MIVKMKSLKIIKKHWRYNMVDTYKTQIEDFRNLKPYYDLVFDNMTALSTFSFERNYQKLTDALRELITNAPDYISIKWKDEEKGAEEILELIEDEYQKLFDEKYFINGMQKSLSTETEKDLEEIRDNYLKFCRMLRIKINSSFVKTGFLPKMDKTRQKQQSIKTKGSSI